MNDPNDIFNQEDTHSVLYGFTLPVTLDAFYTTNGEILDNDGLIDPQVAPYSTVSVTGYKSEVPTRPGRPVEYNVVYNATRSRSTDFVSVDVEGWTDTPAWDYTPVYQGFRDVTGTDYLQFTQRQITVFGPQGQTHWSVEAHETFIRIIDPDNHLTDVVFTQASEIPHLHMAFDSEARPVVAWEHNGLIYVYRFDDEYDDYLVVQAAEGRTPFIGQRSYDDQSDISEQFLIYARLGGLRYRIASEHFGTEYTVFDFNVDTVLNVGLTALGALVITYLDASVDRVGHIATDSSGVYSVDTIAAPNMAVQNFRFLTTDQSVVHGVQETVTPPAFGVDQFTLSFQVE